MESGRRCLLDCRSAVWRALFLWMSGCPADGTSNSKNGEAQTCHKKKHELIVGVDFTKSNQNNGELSFGGRSLHDIDGPSNPYEQVLEISARTLDVYDSDHLIPCYGFGDHSTGSQTVFSFFKKNQPAQGLEELLKRYTELVPSVDMSGPTSFAPIIRQAMKDVYNSGMKFHILLIVADGQVSPQCAEETKQAIIEACDFPLSIVVIGVGDGPWEEMKKFDAALPERRWDNFRFCRFDNTLHATETAASDGDAACFEANALKELPEHYEHATALTGAANRQRVSSFVRTKLGAAPLDPPHRS